MAFETENAAATAASPVAPGAGRSSPAILPAPTNEACARMAPLAKLPVFWALEGKRVIVVGGSDASAWKAELLAACGAEVHVHADGLSGTFETLIERGAGHRHGCFVRHREPWSLESFSGATLAVADFERDEEARAFFEAAHMAGVPVNVIDKPDFCQFQFGSIVNRSPVVVAISTDGAAPILAQAIRRRIEALLPASLKNWAELARSLREKINERLSPGPQRRAFWEHFVDRVFAGSGRPEEGAGRLLLSEAERLRGQSSSQRGRVTLVGAGPGDAELLTLKAMRALQAADVILFDDLVSGEVLELARREARRIVVGGGGDGETCRQEGVAEMMVTLAKAGRRVVRLKAGDPTTLGRACKEIGQLESRDIRVDIIPGIAAAGAMTARFDDLPALRGRARSARFATGQSRRGRLPGAIGRRPIRRQP